MELRTLTHWLNWTIPNDIERMSDIANMKAHIRDQGFEHMAYLSPKLIGSHGMERCTNQRPYSIAYKARETGVRVHMHPNMPHMLWSASGEVCEKLHQMGLLDLVIESMASDVSRIDIALDARTTMTPKQFLAHGVTDRIRSRGSFKSDDGLTEYLGSRHSDRFVAIYRYFPPHVRADWLRIEIRYGGKRAKAIASAFSEASLAQIMQGEIDKLRLGAASAWNIADAPHKVENWHPERSEHKTELWLRTQVFAAFTRLVAEGVIQDPAGYLQAHFLDRLPT